MTTARRPRIGLDEFAEFVKLLLIGGNETTRNAISHGVRLFSEFPDERARFQADPDGYGMSAADEILRYSAPVTLMRRTATRDVEVAGVTVREGEKIVMWFRSGNFDDEVFDDPWRFDIGRTPNDHLTFGAGGPHFCLGANLARVEIAVMLKTLYSAPPRPRDHRTRGEDAGRLEQRHQAPPRRLDAALTARRGHPRHWTLRRGRANVVSDTRKRGAPWPVSRRRASTPRTRPVRPTRPRSRVVDLGGLKAARVTFQPGWKWSDSIKPVVQTESCQLHHEGTLVPGRRCTSSTTTAPRWTSDRATRT